MSEIGGQPRCFGWDIEQNYRYNWKNQQKTSRYKTHHILIITKILVVNKTNIMLYWHEKKKKKKIQTKIEDFHKINIKEFTSYFFYFDFTQTIVEHIG